MAYQTTPGWRECKALPFTQEHETSSGRWRIEYLHGEWKTGATFPTTYRYRIAVTFLSEDGRRVEWTQLGGGTTGEIISNAGWYARNGLARVTYP